MLLTALLFSVTGNLTTHCFGRYNAIIVTDNKMWPITIAGIITDYTATNLPMAANYGVISVPQVLLPVFLLCLYVHSRCSVRTQLCLFNSVWQRNFKMTNKKALNKVLACTKHF